MSKLYSTILIIAILVGIGLIFYFFGPIGKPKIGSNEAALIINYGETKRAFIGEIIEGMTISDALLVSAKAGNFDFDYEGGVLKRIGEFEINGKKWNIYLNGYKAEESLDKVFIEAKDKIELKFE